VNVTAKILPPFLIRQMTLEPLARFEFPLGYWKFYFHYVGEVPGTLRCCNSGSARTIWHAVVIWKKWV
jgi:hypothetical protein